ncbi:MAG TPA: formyltetrahydrofolate deformylase [Sulfurovum sp.]|jgi:formyltetrahydrofolate deformylase|nr:MAG: formyltetrahydrofolate deformylase [Sulfurovum sp. 35-42-20]OYZ26018.1 MAG: formyltetrahydrofolate deformylase [Sulfurovum sp. 16-42-52]OYZ50408.1 MAG: formyltetrahydrofolate deformylase [Sulfurovum sp. 24-42-9]OZA46046.1 MAG: formyltetrahydrofolate deformylase [Sulfurovum sp. 17-42-90]OZA60295.1 MAG: formyltetrahydrofolate deformylase [Sulfurovum sp. 39-42-12]HQR73389.1 formyltetrahydrofolate deformylase [Sulfurovum sp.]
MEKTARVLIDCKDAKGLVYKISKVFYDRGLNIDNNREFVDKENERFFMRTVVSGAFDVKELLDALKADIPGDAHIRVIEPEDKKIILLATKESHALGDILVRHADGELDAQIQCVIANHDTLQTFVRRFDIPFFHIPAEGMSREEHEELVMRLIGEFEFDYIVLAKYMRILTPTFVKAYPEQIINIHHSFLPAFIGANPYKQAFDRGVKIIGATAHFVTDDLDEGPIIAQDVIPVNHRLTWKDMQRAGRDGEKIVLSRALTLVLDDRVFVNGNKTVIF